MRSREIVSGQGPNRSQYYRGNATRYSIVTLSECARRNPSSPQPPGYRGESRKTVCGTFATRRRSVSALSLRFVFIDVFDQVHTERV